jgi:osmotically-inducible protein OsmY
MQTLNNEIVAYLNQKKIYSLLIKYNMDNNELLQKNVQDAIKWEPLLHAAEIGVIVKDGVVTLTGTVDNYMKKAEAEIAAKNVLGVKAVVELINVKFSTSINKNGTDIAEDVLKALKLNWELPTDKIQIKVEDGWVSLEGELQWNFQRLSAKNCISKLIGIKGVTNNIVIRSEVKDRVEENEIKKAFDRNWSLKTENIHLHVHNDKVTLSGFVNSWYEKNEAERITWNAPGVKEVVNELEVDYSYAHQTV